MRKRVSRGNAPDSSHKTDLPPRTRQKKFLQTEEDPLSQREHPVKTKMSDVRETQNKPLMTLTGADNYLRWKAYAMSELRQSGCNGAVTGQELPTVDSIKAKLMDRGFQNNQLKPKILINMLVQDEEKHNLGLAKAIGILSKLVSDALQSMIENKTPQEAWNALQERFQHVDVMSTSRIIYEATSCKLSDFKSVTEYTISYQAAFDKIGSLLADSSPYTHSAVPLVATNEENTFTCPKPLVNRTSNVKLPLTAWHRRLGHLSF